MSRRDDQLAVLPAGPDPAEMLEWMQDLAGRFIVFDGPDGSGKSTQFARFSQAARDAGLDVCEVREPGGTRIGEQIRSVLLNKDNTEMSLRCEMLLYMASRAQLIEQVVRPKLSDGALVLADRFVSSTLAYQGTAGGLEIDEIMTVATIAIGSVWPDLTVIFDVDEQTRAERIGAARPQGKKKRGVSEPTLFSDRMERKSAEYHARVRDGYLAQAERDPDHYAVIDGRADAETVHEALLVAVRRLVDRSTD